MAHANDGNRPIADVVQTLRMADMEINNQEQVVGTPDQPYWFQVIFEDVNFACGVIKASLVAPSYTA